MARVKGGFTTRRRRKKTLKLAKGYWGAKSRKYAYRDRRQLKREMRKLWIARINAACRMNDMSYSTFMHGLKLAEVNVNRKMLSEIAIADPEGFKALTDLAKEQLAK